MSKTEDLLYEAIDEGIRDAVFNEVQRLRVAEPTLSKKDFSDILEVAISNIRKEKNNENI
tara:strand:+ start:7927 stop:8106 length:180 start_codon:yes stop_codon:yes gene_type:complete